LLPHKGRWASGRKGPVGPLSVTGMAPNLAVNQGPLMGYMVRFHGSALNFVADPIFRM